ncbi:MAG: hypothetical protein JSS89_09955 [Bacteroidetes bacterium]|nr:hypothetical protein [Bacteroidota bacterium]
MMYMYENLSPTQFETLIVLLCQRLLGVSVQGFSTGPDGGRDAKFVGTSELHPSTRAPWVGTTIIQAKHTNSYNLNFSGSDFFSVNGKSSIIADEIPRIKRLRQDGNLDNYMLFSNRRLAANAETTIRAHISSECSIPIESIYLCGIEQLELWLKRFKEVASEADIDPIDSPLIVSPDELATVVEAFARNRDDIVDLLDDPPTNRVSYEEKNVRNNMTPEYAKVQRRNYLKETAQIRNFLSAPENLELLRMYESAVDEFQLKIIAKRSSYQTFDAVMEYLIDLLYGRDPVLRQHGHKRLTRAVLFYMYWNCDIGEGSDASTD